MFMYTYIISEQFIIIYYHFLYFCVVILLIMLFIVSAMQLSVGLFYAIDKLLILASHLGSTSN